MWTFGNMVNYLLLFVFTTTSVWSQRIITPPSSTVGLTDETAQFVCEVDTNGFDFIEWYFGNELIYYRLNGKGKYPGGTYYYTVANDGSVSTLTVKRLREQLTEFPYGCKVLGGDPAYATLTVLDGAISYFGPYSVSGVITGTAKYDCRVNQAVIDSTEFLFGNTVIYQHHDGQGDYLVGDSKYSVDFDESRSQFSLTISNLSITDTDFPYICRVVTEYSVLESEEKSLTVLESGMITPPAPTSGVIGGKAHFRCDIGMSEFEYMEWLFGTTVVYYYLNGAESYPTGGTKYSVIREGSVFTLTVDELTLADGDFPYGCKILGEDPEQALLTVQESGIINGPSPAIGVVGGSAKFTCEIDLVASEYIQWRFGDTVIYKHYVNGEDDNPKEDEKYHVEVDEAKFRLTVKNLTLEDAALPYICEVPVSDPVEAKLDVVEYGGKILSAPYPTSGMVGGTAEFGCTTETAAVLYYMEWRFGDTVIYYRQNGEDYYPMGDSKYSVKLISRTFTLTINNLEKSDEALPYSCNVLETPPAEAMLTIKGETFDILYDYGTGQGQVTIVGNSVTIDSLSILPNEVRSTIISGEGQLGSQDVNVDLTTTVLRLDNFKKIRYSFNINDPDMDLLRVKHIEMLQKEGWKIFHKEYFQPKVFIQWEKK